MSPCATCGTPTGASYRLCPDCLRSSTTAERAAQGLPAKVTDPLVLDRVATIVRPSLDRKAVA